MNKNSKILVFSLIALVIVMLAFILEWRDVPVIKNWEEKYRYDLDDPFDTSAFREALEYSYGAENIVQYNSIDSIHDYNNSLYINIGYSIFLNESKSAELVDFIKNGNVALFITDYVSASDSLLSDDYFYMEDVSDSLDQVQFVDTDSLKCEFKYYSRNLNKAVFTYTSAFTEDIMEDSNYVSLATVDSLIVFQKRKFGNGSVYRYTTPYHFSNLVSLQDDFRRFYNHIFGRFDVETVIIDRPRLADRIESRANNSPIKYILAQPSLKWAYYLTILLALLYIVFKGKRRQKIIPLQNKNENTSLEYVDTLSQLFLAQRQNVKLIDHMEDQFYHKVQKRYFIDKNNPYFIDVLNKKSKVEKKEIEKITNTFTQASNGYSFTDDQLHRLFNNLNQLYTKWK